MEFAEHKSGARYIGIKAGAPVWQDNLTGRYGAGVHEGDIARAPVSCDHATIESALRARGVTFTAYKVKLARNGALFVNGRPTPFSVEFGKLPSGAGVWYLVQANNAPAQVAWHGRRRDVMQAALVFLEGATPAPGESESAMVKRALNSCMQTGSKWIQRLQVTA